MVTRVVSGAEVMDAFRVVVVRAGIVIVCDDEATLIV